MVGKSKGNKQVNKNAAKEKSTDSNKKKRMVKARGELGGGLARGKAENKNIDTIIACRIHN